jgi:hypothetical protein
MFIRSLINPALRYPEDDGGGSGSGDLDAAVRAAVEKATNGLVAKNQELLNEIKAERSKRSSLEQQIAQIGDTGDIAKAREIMERMQADADLQMIANGGKPAFEEVLNRRTKGIITEERQKVEAAQMAVKTAEERATAALQRWRSERMDNEVARVVGKARALPEATEFIKMKAASMFEFDDESNSVRLRPDLAKDAIDRNGNPLTLDTWVESLRDTNSFFFGLPSGGGAGGNSKNGGDRAPTRIDANDSKAISNNLEAIAKGTVVLDT